MKKYKVLIVETVEHIVTVEAKDEETACVIAGEVLDNDLSANYGAYHIGVRKDSCEVM